MPSAARRYRGGVGSSLAVFGISITSATGQSVLEEPEVRHKAPNLAPSTCEETPRPGQRGQATGCLGPKNLTQATVEGQGIGGTAYARMAIRVQQPTVEGRLDYVPLIDLDVS